MVIGGKMISFGCGGYINEGGETTEVYVLVLGKVTAHY